MDQDCVNFSQERKIKDLDGQLAIENLSRCAKIVLQRREKHINKCNQASYSTKYSNNILSSQKHISTKKKKKSSIQIQNTHTHTKQVQPILYFKNKLKQFSEHTLTHVFLVMTKSHCTCTCIQSSKECCVLCVKTSQDFISV